MEFLDRWLAETGALPNDRPLVTLSYAQTLDGSISLRRGEPFAISGPESQTLTHHLRAAHSAILVGIGTVLSDDPQLNVRLVEGQDPQIVVLDSNLRFPKSAKLLDAKKKLWVFCNASASKANQTELEQSGVKVERQEGGSPEIDLPLLLNRLWEFGIRTLMVEGGGKVIASFLANRLVDRMMLTIAPMFIDGYRVPLKAHEPHRLADTRMERAGDDIMIFGRMVIE